MAELRWIEPGEWRYLIDIFMDRKYLGKLKSEMVRDICMRCSSEREKAKRKEEFKAFRQYQKDEVDRITREIMGDLKDEQVRLRSRGELAFKDESLRDAVVSDLSLPKGWKSRKSESGGALTF